jgi:hypothetical protein
LKILTGNFDPKSLLVGECGQDGAVMVHQTLVDLMIRERNNGLCGQMSSILSKLNQRDNSPAIELMIDQLSNTKQRNWQVALKRLIRNLGHHDSQDNHLEGQATGHICASESI